MGPLSDAPAPANPEELGARLERYRQLRANVRRRRTAYIIIIILAITVLVMSIVDIAFVDSKLKWLGVFPAYAILLILAILLLFSRKRHMMELEELRQLERSLLQCPDCMNVFRFGSIRWREHKKSAFSCPVCGVYSKLPGPDTPPVEAYVPAGSIRELDYRCTNCSEEFAIGTFEGTPLHQVKFRACPNCEQKGFIERVASIKAV